jgi:type II secretory pathway component PulJ
MTGAIRNSQSSIPRRRRAFTLVEVILAVGLTIGIVMAALAFYQQIISTRQAFADRLGAVEVTATRRALMERMTDELRSAIVYRFLQMGLTGDAMSMQFMVAGLPGQAVWATDDNTDRPPVPQQDMRIVGYRLRQSEDPYTGLPTIDGVERTEQTVIAATTVEEGVNVTATLIGPSFKFLSLRYWDGQSGQWLTSWDGGDAPMAVEIVIGIEPLPEGMEPVDYPFEAFRRVVHVPAGKKSFGGTTIMRGLGSLPQHATGAGGAVQ